MATDIEKSQAHDALPATGTESIDARQNPAPGLSDEEAGERKVTRQHAIIHRLLSYGRVEERGVVPVPEKDRTATKHWKVFSIWFSMNVNILA